MVPSNKGRWGDEYGTVGSDGYAGKKCQHEWPNGRAADAREREQN